MSDSESDVSEHKSELDRNEVQDMVDGVYTLIELGPRDDILAESIIDAINIRGDFPEIYKKLNGLLTIYVCLGYVLQPKILNIQWLLDNSLERKERNPFLADILRKMKMKRPGRDIVTARNINENEKKGFQRAYIKLIKGVPILNKLYLDNVSQMTSEVLRPRDDSEFYDQGVNDLVGSFLFKGRKSRRRSVTRKSGRRKSVKKLSRKSKHKSRTPNKARKPRKSK